jgi:uncharacterized OB-fold protein
MPSDRGDVDDNLSLDPGATMMQESMRPLPIRNPDTKAFWDACREHILQFKRCTSCATVRSLPMPGCSGCGGREFEWVRSKGNGSVYTFTVTHQVLHPGFPTVPYVAAVVVLDVGTRLVSRIVDCATEVVRIGMDVTVVWEDLPDADTSLPLFKPLTSSGGSV